MPEPSVDTILAALARAKELLKCRNGWSLLKALAEATTSATCGKESYKVFRDVRIEISRNISEPLHDFSNSSTRPVAIAAIDRTIHALRGN